MMEKKICKKCGVEKELCEFYFRKERGKSESQCKICRLDV